MHMMMRSQQQMSGLVIDDSIACGKGGHSLHCANPSSYKQLHILSKAVCLGLNGVVKAQHLALNILQLLRLLSHLDWKNSCHAHLFAYVPKFHRCSGCEL